MGGQFPPHVPTDSDYLNGSLVSFGYLPFFVQLAALAGTFYRSTTEDKQQPVGSVKFPKEAAALGLCPGPQPALHGSSGLHGEGRRRPLGARCDHETRTWRGTGQSSSSQACRSLGLRELLQWPRGRSGCPL